MKEKEKKVKSNKPEVDPWELDQNAVTAKKRECEFGSGQNKQWLKFEEYMGDKSSRKLVVRPLPRRGKGKFWKDYAYHYDLEDEETGNKVSRPCPKVFSGLSCPIDEAAEQCRKSGTEEGKAIYSKHRAKSRSAIQVMVGDDPDKIQILGLTSNQFRDIIDIVQDSDYGNIAHPSKGFELVLTLKRNPRKKYIDLTSITPGRQTKVPKEVLENLVDLDELLECDIDPKALKRMVPSDIKEFLRMAEADTDLDDEDASVDFDVDDDEVPFESTGKKGGDEPECFGSFSKGHPACVRCALNDGCREAYEKSGKKKKVEEKFPVIKNKSTVSASRKRVPSSIESEIDEMLDSL